MVATHYRYELTPRRRCRRTPPLPPPSIDQVWRDNAILTGTLIILVSLLVGAGVACRCYEVSGVWALAASILLAKPES